MELNTSMLDKLVRMALQEDVGPGDLTSLACLVPDPVTARIVAKSDGVLSGTIAARRVFEIVDSANRLEFLRKDGERFAQGDVIAEIDGFNQTILVSERVALNFLAHLSGVASLTAKFVAKLSAKGLAEQCAILDTRKTTPGWRQLEKLAVLHGGGKNHRMGLYDMVLIKDNHIAAAGSVTAAVERTRQYLATADFRLQFDRKAEDVAIEVEVTNADQLKEAIAAGVHRLLLDNQTPATLKQLVTLARELDPGVRLEASGNVNLDNVAEVAASGVDFISIGALTHSAPASDFSLVVEPS